jgi:PKD repeat protein
MKSTCWRSSVIAILLCGGLSALAIAAPTFTDQDLDNGNVNPNDEVVVQEIRIVNSGTSTINSVSLQNIGTADETDIVRVVIDDDADPFTAPLAEYTALTGLRSGLLLTLNYTIPNGTSYLWIGVEIAGAGTVAGGEKIQLRVRFYSGSFTSPYLTDGSPETIVEAGFETTADDSPSTKYLNPNDANILVQKGTFTDDDGNDSTVGITKVAVSNENDADHNDVVDVHVTIKGKVVTVENTYTAAKAPAAADWGSGNPIEFANTDFTPNLPAAFDDDEAALVEVRVTIGGTTDKHRIQTEVTVTAVENGETYTKSLQASTTHTIRVQGFEAIDEVSASVPSGVKSPGESLVQKVTVADDDENLSNVAIVGIWIKNDGTATKDDIAQILVKRGATTLFTLNGASIVDFATGHRYVAGDGFAATTVTDNQSLTLTVEYKIDGTITDGRTLQPKVYVWTTENAQNYESDRVTYPTSIVLHPHGLESVLNVSMANGSVYSGQRAVVQKILCEDQDENSDSVLLNPVGIKNIAANPCTDAEVVKIEVRTEGGALLGETTNIAGLSAGGVVVSTLQNNTVADNGTVTLLIYVTFAGPEGVTAGHKLRLETTIFSEEDGHTGVNAATGDVEWTLAINHRPVPNFTFAKATTAAAAIGPKADFAAADTIQFTGTATDSDGDAIASWSWNFGDGSSASVQNPTHQYPNGGTFTVTLTVTDARGLTGSVSKTIEVTSPPNDPPTIDEVTADPQNAALNEDIDFGATVTDSDQPPGTAFGYEWDFDDETTSTTANPTHSYDEAGVYTVTLTVTDARGGTDTATIDVTVGNDPPTLTGVSAAPATGVSTGDEITFTATGYDDPNDDAVDHYEWAFGDGTTLSAGDQTETHVFAAPGTYTVSVVAVDDRSAKSSAATVSVTVSGPARTILFAFPNPAETVATFSYFLSEGATDPILRIYNLTGELVLERELPEGGTAFEWDLRTAGGTAQPNGLYFCVVTATGADPSEIFRLLIAR